MLKLTILGCHSATPKAGAHPTSQVLEIKGHQFLIDCGEGTQMQLRKYKVKFSRIRHIFISHLHGDHFFGLVGLISTFALLGRDSEIHIYGPKAIKEVILLQLKVGKSYTKFSLYFHELTSKEPELLFEDNDVSVHTIPLDHRIYTNGFLFKEKIGERKLNIEAVRKANIDVSYYSKLKQGADVLNNNGDKIENASVTFDPDSSKSYAYCSDTAYYPQIIEQIKDCTILYHESTFLDEHKHLCEKTKHSTAKEAASIAKQANVETLILGHYSGRYKDIAAFKTEAQEIFQNVHLPEDGKEFIF